MVEYTQKELADLKKTYDILITSPGLEFRDLQARTHLDMRALRTCLNKLQETELIRGEVDDSYIRYFISHKLTLQEMKIMSLLRHIRIRKIVFYLLEHPNSRPNEVAKECHISKQSLTQHITKLEDVGAISYYGGMRPRLKISNPDQIMGLLIKYKESFLDRLVNNFIETWTND